MGFLKNASLCRTNVKLDKDGFANFNKLPLHLYSTIQVVVTDHESTVTRCVPLSNNVIESKDLRLYSKMEADKPYSTMRETTTVLEGGVFKCDDFSRIELETIDNFGKLFRILKELGRLTGYSGDLEGDFNKFDWVVDWPYLKEEKKLSYYDKFVCHEVNLFLYFRDRKFFDKNVAKFVRNKLEKTFVDYFLLGCEKTMKSYASPNKFTTLNTME